MIDTHSHLLPGLDDGSPDLETSLLMAARAEAAGVTTVVCTPHLRELDASFVTWAHNGIKALKSALAKENIHLNLLLGFEIDLNVVGAASSADLRELTIEGSGGALLIETPHWGWPVFAREAIFRLRTAGFSPVLAHPERNDRIQHNPGLLTECLQAGALAQATAASLDGEFGRSCRQAFYRHLLGGEISLLASDAHCHRSSSWTLDSLMAKLRGRISEDDLNMLTTVNPGFLIAGGRPGAVMPTVRRRLYWPSKRP